MSDRVLAPDIVDPLVAGDAQTERTTGLWRDTLRSVLRQRSAVIGLIILGLLVFTAVFAPLIATHDPDGRLLGVEPGVKQRAAPCIHLLGCPADQPQHLFGTDGNFRDVFSRVVFGARTSLIVGLAAIAGLVETAATDPAMSRAMRFGAEQVALQHRGLWDLLQARAQARIAA